MIAKKERYVFSKNHTAAEIKALRAEYQKRGL
jgi:hypothetical protein